VQVSKEAKKLMRALLTPDAKKRLGSEHGAADIKAHPFFSGINWALVADTKPPMVPRLIDPEHEAGKQGDEEEAPQVSIDYGTASVAGGKQETPQQDPFKDFEHVSKPEEPSELQLMRADKANNENE
jgi:hypothetical protein